MFERLHTHSDPMKIEKIDILCLALAVFLVLTYWKLENVVFLLVAIVLVVPVVYFQFKPDKEIPQKSA